MINNQIKPTISNNFSLTNDLHSRSPVISRSGSSIVHSEPKLNSTNKYIILCQDCEQILGDSSPTYKQKQSTVNICQTCAHNRRQRRELIIELVREEIAYGEEIRCLQREVSDRMLKAGLITGPEHHNIFGNLVEIIRHNANFLSMFREEIWKALQSGDQSYQSLEIGRYFNESYSMFLSYEAFCNTVNQKVDEFHQVEIQKPTVKSFLSNCQEQVTAFNSGPDIKLWLLKPLQRIIRYPVLLECIRKVTPRIHSDWMNIKRAIAKINFYLKRIRTKNISFPAYEKSFTTKPNVVKFDSKDSIVDWPKLASREMESEIENTTLLMADFVGFERVSLKQKMTKRHRKYVAMLVMLSNYSDMYVHGSEKEIYLLVLKEIANNDFMTIRKLNIHECCFFVSSERPLILDATQIETSETTSIKFSSAEVSSEWLSECKKFSQDNCKWNKRRNALGNIMLDSVTQ